jgi:hypothetical protein
VFVILDIGTRRVVHWNLTAHPTAEWTIQQFRDGLLLDGAYRLRWYPIWHDATRMSWIQDHVWQTSMTRNRGSS